MLLKYKFYAFYDINPKVGIQMHTGSLKKFRSCKF